MYCNYSCHFSGSTHIYFTKTGGRKVGLGEERWGWGKKGGAGGWGSVGTPIDMSSFYLQNEFLLSFELTRPLETTLPYGVSPLAEANVFWEKRETFPNMKTCKGTCGTCTCTLVSHS